MTERLLTSLGIESRLCVSSEQLNQMVRDRQIPFVQLPGGQIRFREASVSEWVRKQEIQSNERNV